MCNNKIVLTNKSYTLYLHSIYSFGRCFYHFVNMLNGTDHLQGHATKWIKAEVSEGENKQHERPFLLDIKHSYWLVR